MSTHETVGQHEGNGTVMEPTAREAGRDSQGRFSKGNPGGPGNPFARQVGRLRTVLLERLDEDKLRAIADKLLELAMEGDVAAMRLLLSYTLGRPAAAVEPDELDVQEIELHRREQVRDLMDYRSAVPASAACVVLREVVPLHVQRMGEAFEAQSKALDEAKRLEQERREKEEASRKERQEKEAARRQAQKEKRQAQRAQETEEQREARQKAAREAAKAARARRVQRQAQRDQDLPTVEQILAWARQGPEAALAEARTVTKAGETGGGSPNTGP
jgi:hypothetical protein